jgi:hypothetical protein
MSNRRKIKDKGRIPGQWTALRWELLDSPAWKATSPGARLLYISLLRRLSYNALNNGKIFRSTREAAKEIGVAQRSVWMWFRELEHYGFIAMTSPGCIGPGGKAARWRITDMAWGVLAASRSRPPKTTCNGTVSYSTDLKNRKTRNQMRQGVAKNAPLLTHQMRQPPSRVTHQMRQRRSQ